MDQLMNFGPFAALGKIWNQLSGPQRMIVGVFAALAAALVLMVAVTASKPRMSVLFSGLESEDAGAIAQKLTSKKIPYRLSADGTTIEVPANKVYDLRLEMATQGLPQGGNVGFELFDKNSFGLTEFEQRVNYERAIQGELTRTICQLAPVAGARVHIVIPREKIFGGEQEPPTASVVLKLRRGTPLTDEQTGGVVHLVASAVEGLKPSNVTVIDSDGSVLSDGGSGSGGGGLLTANQTKLKRQYESELSQNIQSMLARIVGADKVVVRVSADLDFDQKQTKSESYEPMTAAQASARGVLLSEETTNETYSGGGVVPPGGIPVARGRASGGARGSGDNYSRTESATRYEVSKRIEETVSSPGKIRRLSVAVMVDDKVEPTKLGAIRECVSAAAGFDQARGDLVTVQRIGFDTVSEKAEQAAMEKASKSDMIRGIAKNVGAVVLLLAFLFFLRSITRQIKVQMPSAQAMATASEAQFSAPAIKPADMFNAPGPVIPSPEPTAQPSPNFSTSRPENSIPPEVAQSSPEELAGLIRTWMAEE